MAEFTEVCKLALRMLKAEEGAKCLVLCFSEKDGVRVEGGRYGGYSTGKAEAIEKHIMQWAAEHPEPVYPTWKEWQEANFSRAPRPICLLNFMSRAEACCEWESCTKCLAEPIPAHIAAKLGIKPIKGGDGK